MKKILLGLVMSVVVAASAHAAGGGIEHQRAIVDDAAHPAGRDSAAVADLQRTRIDGRGARVRRRPRGQNQRAGATLAHAAGA